jgi:hypothetical protein
MSSPTPTTYVYSASFAAAFGEGPLTITRLWGDSKLIYKGGQDFGSVAPWNSSAAYVQDDIVTFRFFPPIGGGTTQIYQCILPNTNVIPEGEQLYWATAPYAFWLSSIQYYPGNEVVYPGLQSEVAQYGTVYACIRPSLNDHPPSSPQHWQQVTAYYQAPTFYPGNQTQLPDPLIQGIEGANNTPAFRGIAYCVWEDFPLANFGNRVPNLRADVIFCSSPSTSGGEPSTLFSDAFNRADGPVGSNWTAFPPKAGQSHGTLDIVSDQLVGTETATPATDDMILANQALAQDQWVQVTYISSNGGLILLLRSDSGGVGGNPAPYAWNLAFDGIDNFWQLYDSFGTYFVDSTHPTAVAMPGGMLHNGDVVRFEAQGSTFRVIVNSTTLYSGPVFFEVQYNQTPPVYTTDNPIWPPTSPTEDPSAFIHAGLWFYHWSCTVDDFSCGTFGGGGGPCVPSSLAGAIDDLCLRAGLDSSEIDTSLITDTNVQPVQAMRGYVINRPTTAAQSLQEIMRAYFIDACESGGAVRFVPRGMPQPYALTIAEDDLGLHEDQTEIVEQQSQEQDLPISTTVLFNDQQLNYEQGKQIKMRNPRILTIGTRNQRVLSLPFSFLPTEAHQIAEADLYSTWFNRLGYQMNLWRASWALLDPTDLVSFVYEDVAYTMRITSSHLGQGLAVALEGVLEDYRNYLSTSIGASGGSTGGAGSGGSPGGGGGTSASATGGGTMRGLAWTQLFLLDIPLLHDLDANPGGTGFYVALSSGDSTWGGGSLYMSTDDASFSDILDTTTPASFGYPTAALAAPSSPWAWDTVNTLTIQMVIGTLAGESDANVLAGSNRLVVGNEVIQFADCTDNGGGSFTISRLLRGRRGTDNACGSHATGETALAAATVLREAEPNSWIGLARYYRGVTSGQSVTAVPDTDMTLAGNDLKPYSVVNIGGSQDASNNWTITWTRRTRYGGSYGTGAEALIDGLNGPLNEASEAYQIDVMSGSTVKRTISVTAATAVYTAAQQIVDFGSVQSSLTVNIYQISAAVGRGWEASATLPASGASPVAIVSGDTYVN